MSCIRGVKRAGARNSRESERYGKMAVTDGLLCGSDSWFMFSYCRALQGISVPETQAGREGTNSSGWTEREGRATEACSLQHACTKCCLHGLSEIRPTAKRDRDVIQKYPIHFVSDAATCWRPFGILYIYFMFVVLSIKTFIAVKCDE